MKPKEYFDMHVEEMIAELGALIEIPSVLDKNSADEGSPFGRNIANALTYVLNKASEWGMRVKNYDGYAGEITVGAEQNLIGILAHLDVVGAGDGWKTEPFRAKVIDGEIYGRGSSDDKGPVVAALYAVKYLWDEKLLPEGSGIRMILGTDEEEEWRCITHYLSEIQVLPKYSIVPDANFPLINCEKGLLDADFSYACVKQENAEYEVKVKNLSGGSAKNVVPGKASFLLQCKNDKITDKVKQKLAEFEKISVKIEGNTVLAEVNGKSTHAMSPEKGLNAISLMMQSLGKLEETFFMEDVAAKYNRYVGMNYYGERLHCDLEDEVSGKLTFNVGTIRYDGRSITFGTSIRYPATVKKKQITETLIKQCAEAEIDFHICSEMDGLYMNENAEFIQRLMQSYRKVSKDENAVPLAIGGATYARAIPNAVAFGPLFPYEEELAHEPNERLSIESFEKMTLIYIEALKNLLDMLSQETKSCQ